MAFIKNNNEVYVIAEIGQNHNGDINIAKKLIDQLVVYPYDEITGNRLNCVNGIKLCKRDMLEELSNEAYNKPYNNPNSFGKTYGEHREFLELSYDEHIELGNYIKSKGVEFVDTLCSVTAVKKLAPYVDKIKVASRDLTNIPLLREIAKYEKNVILSTGMNDIIDLKNAISILEVGKTTKIIILHCLSQYPSEYSNINLRTIEWLTDKYLFNFEIGYSDHSLGNHIALAAVAMGAKYIEKHVTLDKTMKGTDHKGSLEPHEFKELMHNIRTFELAKGEYKMFKHPSTKSAEIKLKRSLAYNKDLKQGHEVTENDIYMISPGNGLEWEDFHTFNYVKLKYNVKKNNLVKFEDFI